MEPRHLRLVLLRGEFPLKQPRNVIHTSQNNNNNNNNNSKVKIVINKSIKNLKKRTVTRDIIDKETNELIEKYYSENKPLVESIRIKNLKMSKFICKTIFDIILQLSTCDKERSVPKQTDAMKSETTIYGLDMMQLADNLIDILLILRYFDTNYKPKKVYNNNFVHTLEILWIDNKYFDNFVWYFDRAYEFSEIKTKYEILLLNKDKIKPLLFELHQYYVKYSYMKKEKITKIDLQWNDLLKRLVIVDCIATIIK